IPAVVTHDIAVGLAMPHVHRYCDVAKSEPPRLMFELNVLDGGAASGTGYRTCEGGAQSRRDVGALDHRDVTGGQGAAHIRESLVGPPLRLTQTRSPRCAHQPGNGQLKPSRDAILAHHFVLGDP